MSKPIAMLRISDVEPLMSILPMMDAAGYDYVLPNRELRNLLRDMRCRNVDEIPEMVKNWGAEPAPKGIHEVGPDFMAKCSLYVDVNGNLNGPKVWSRWKNLKDRVLTYFINGGEPRNTEDKGDCQTPATPMMTTAQHYRSTLFCPKKHWNVEAFSCDNPPHPRGYWTNRELSHPKKKWYDDSNPSEAISEVMADQDVWLCPHGCGPLIPAPWTEKVYTFYPLFTRHNRLLPRTDGSKGYGPPVSFVHNCLSWGCQSFVEPARKLGVKAYGGGNSPDGLIPHNETFAILAKALCTVYLKGGGAVDYSILEPMAAGCPTTFHWSYRHHCRLYDLLEPGVTCLTWEDEKGIAECLERLSDPVENQRIGEAGRERVKEVVWKDPEGFKKFVERWFPN